MVYTDYIWCIQIIYIMYTQYIWCTHNIYGVHTIYMVTAQYELSECAVDKKMVTAIETK